MVIPTSTTYKVGNTYIPSPTSVTVSIEPLHSEATGRADDGKMNTTIISNGKRVVNIKYDVMPQSQLSALLALVNVQYYDLKYLDPIDGMKTIHCYGTPISTELYSNCLYNGLWRNVTINCIER